MDVRCERCNTEYEFDDALVSGRGTTVKCTNCGHKFKIRRKDGDFSEDFWNVETREGKTLVFTSLRELQRAIQNRLVDREDKLSRGGLPPKAIGGIPELVAFFDQRDQKDNAPRRTLPPIAAPPPPDPPRRRIPTKPEFQPISIPEPMPTPIVRPAAQTLVGTGSLEEAALLAAPSMRSRMGSVPPPESSEPAPETESSEMEAAPNTEPLVGRPILPSDPPRVPTAPPPAPVVEAASPKTDPPPAAPDTERPPPPVDDAYAPEPSVPVVFSEPIIPPTPPPPVVERSVPIEFSSPLPPPPVMHEDVEEVSDPTPMRRTSPSIGDAPPSSLRRRGVGGFIVAFVVFASIGLVAVLWAKGHLGQFLGGKGQGGTTSSDPRVTELLAQGEKALDAGDLAVAGESFDKASGLAGKDPKVLVDVARLASARADQQWLKSRLLPAEAVDEHRTVQASLVDLASRARKAADEAVAASPDDVSAVRTKIDALRISGERDGARALVSKIASSGAQAETSYVLAALDLAENEPLWSTVIERLKAAASAETGPGRARLALVYALARSGDGAGARLELSHVDAKKTDLYPALSAFVDRSGKTAVKSSVDAGVPVDVPDPQNPKKTLSNDPRVLVAQAETARAKGDFKRAEQLFNAALDKNPNDTEALAGIASIHHARHDLPGAKAAYNRVLSSNPSYVPALVGLGDVEWESGDRASAMKTYKQIVDRFPDGTYPARIKQRLEPATAPTAPPSASSAPKDPPKDPPVGPPLPPVNDNGGGG